MTSKVARFPSFPHTTAGLSDLIFEADAYYGGSTSETWQNTNPGRIDQYF